jgi:hypothetical protein
MKTDIDIFFSSMRSLCGFAKDEKYKQFIRDHSCIFCQSTLSEPHHIYGSYGSGMKTCKTTDYCTIPVCRKCHDEKAEKPENKDIIMQYAWRLLIEYVSSVVLTDRTKIVDQCLSKLDKKDFASTADYERAYFRIQKLK